ncbi:MAG: outer membrane beta-barrel protein [bacterium]
MKYKAVLFLTCFVIFNAGMVSKAFAEQPESSFYAYGGINVGAQTIDLDPSYLRKTYGNSGGGVQVGAGFVLTDKFNIELGYSGINVASYLSESEDSTFNMFTHQFAVRAIYHDAINKKMDWYAFGGGGMGVVQFTSTGPLYRDDDYYSALVVTAGGGITLYRKDNWFVGAEGSYAQFNFSKRDPVDERTYNYSPYAILGSFRFGYYFPSD